MFLTEQISGNGGSTEQKLDRSAAVCIGRSLAAHGAGGSLARFAGSGIAAVMAILLAMAPVCALAAETSASSQDRPASRAATAKPAGIVTAALAPAGAVRAIDEAARNEGPDMLLGTVSVPVASLAVTGRWQAIQTAGIDRLFGSDCAGEEAACRSTLRKAYVSIANATTVESSFGLLARVNRAANRALRYQTDASLRGVDDYWATPEETAVSGAGDCEDIAIVKMGMLVALGVDQADMRLLVVKDLNRGIGHALLAVRVGTATYVLDSNRDDVRNQDEVSSFLPLYSVSAAGAWIHGVRRAPSVLVAQN